MLKRLMPALALAIALTVTGFSAQTPIYKLLYSAPDPSSQGAVPVTVFETAPGLFYFLSAEGGPNLGFGPSIFSLTGEGSPKLVYSLPTSFTIAESLVQGADGRLYGAVFDSSRQGLYYSITTAGQGFKQYPTGQWNSMWLLTAAPGKLYDGVGSQEAYALAQIDESGKFTVIHKLSLSEGVPVGGMKLVPATDGNLYGVGNQSIELSPPFFIYRLTPSGGYSQIATFPSALGGTYAPALMVASDGNLYGTFSGGGANDTGLIYAATLSGKWQTVANFPAKGTDEGMLYPNSVLEASDGALYGSTVHNAIFRYDLATHALTLAYQMNSGNLQGSCAPCNLIQAMDGKLYGTAALGGPGGGAVFSLDFGLPKPQPSVAQLIPASGTAGQRILLWGSHLLGATSVAFNGVPAAAFQVNSTQAVMATVPAGATTGPVTITTANGTVTTKQNFSIQ
jgi:uncharacterized repeat protein (TIGR03803 family)